MVHEVQSAKEFDQQLEAAGGKLVVVDFHATWCGPCKVIAPSIEELSKEMTNVVFLKVDVDENEEVAEKYEIKAMPTFKFFKNGKVVTEMLGANLDKLKQLLEEHNK